MTVKPPAPPYLGPAAHTSPGSNKPIKRIVVHATVSPLVKGQARATAAYFRSKSAGGSAHYVVDADEAVQVVYDSVQAWHAPPNANSIGVELCDALSSPAWDKANAARWSDGPHVSMLQHAAALVAQLCLAYDVPIHRLSAADLKAGKHGICGHVDVSQAWHQSTHWDPGEAFPWDTFMGMVRAEAKHLSAPDPKPKPAPKPHPAAAEHTDFVVATQNTPDKQDRPHWLARNQRAKAILALASKLGAEVLALQELATISRTFLLHRRYWRLVSAPFNNVFRTTSLGNSIAYRRRQWTLLDTDNIRVPMANRHRGLNMPVALLEDKDSEARVVVIAVHNPSNRPARLGPVTRRLAKGMEVAYAQRCIDAGLPVIVTGDFNQSDVSEFKAAGFKIAAQVGVDAVLTHGCGIRDGGVDTSLKGKASDHPLVWAKVRVPVHSKSPRSLPKES